jgi:DNA-binding NtrC family response regulator
MKIVLVVEDEPLIRLSLVEAIRAKKYQTAEARDGDAALKLIAARTFDAVVCDSHMPGRMSGLDVLLYYHDLYPDRIKVLLTGQSNREAEDRLKAMGGIYLEKPFAIEDLVVMLARLLED